MAKSLVSFGFRHGGSVPCCEGVLVIDVRKVFNRNPYHNRKLRYLRGTDPAVQEDILKTPGFEESFKDLKQKVVAFNGIVYLGCTGGHHRSVYLAQRLSEELSIPVLHRDFDKK